jgi:hypothetical protein
VRDLQEISIQKERVLVKATFLEIARRLYAELTGAWVDCGVIDNPGDFPD